MMSPFLSGDIVRDSLEKEVPSFDPYTPPRFPSWGKEILVPPSSYHADSVVLSWLVRSLAALRVLKIGR